MRAPSPYGWSEEQASWVELASDAEQQRHRAGRILTTPVATAADVWLSVWNGSSWARAGRHPQRLPVPRTQCRRAFEEASSGEALAVYGVNAVTEVR